MRVSIVVPLHNEALNAELLYRELREFAAEEQRIVEMIFVDDGSTDDTYERLVRASAGDPRVTVLRLRRNFGQTAALSAGFDLATGDVICPMDGDLQNDPREIPLLLAKIEEGYDVVSGWRKDRKDAWLTRRVPSWAANKLISKITNVRLHDYGCALKAYRREVLRGIRLYGEMHRFIPALSAWMGIRVAEVPVRHRARVAGKSKYGLERVIPVILDLINVKFLVSYSTRPIQVFGKVGIASFLAGLLFLALTVFMKYFAGYNITGNPFFILSALCVLVGFQFICIGLLGEITIRTYYELHEKPTYVVRERFNGGSAPAHSGKGVRGA
jgi:glycosyltransferase involved in cell wall biosynthesis